MSAVSIIESVLYFCLLSVIAVRIYNKQIFNPVAVLIPIIAHIILIILAIKTNKDIFTVAHFIVQILNIISVKIIIKDIPLYKIVWNYIIIYFFGVMIIACESCIFFANRDLTVIPELITNLAIAVIMLIVCFTPIRAKIQMYLNTITTTVKVAITLAIVINTVVFGILFSHPIFNETDFIDTSAKVIYIMSTIFALSIFPILITYSQANTALKIKNEDYKKQIQTQAEYYLTLSESNSELRRFKHDFCNIESGLRELIAKNRNDEALKMLADSKSQFLENEMCYNSGNGIVDAILNDKQNKAAQCNADIIFEGHIPTDIVSPADLCIIFGNTLDNAIEACEELPSGMVKNINVNCKYGKDFVFIDISNPTKKEKLRKGKIIETTKSDKENHGFGLYSLSKVLKKYDGSFETSIENNIFTIEIELETNQNHQ